MKKICNWFIHNASMQKKLIISYIILVSIPLCILGIHSFSAANQNLLDQTEVTMDNNLHRMCQEADAIFQRETDFTKYLAYNLEFRQTLEGNAYNGSAIAQSLNKTVEPVFWYFITSDENLKMIKIVTPNTASDIGSFLESAEPYEDTVWYKKHEKDFNTEWTVEEDGKLYATRTILDTATTSRRIGVLRAEFYLNRILEPFDTMDYLDNGIVIKDGNGQVIYTKKIADEQMEQKIMGIDTCSRDDGISGCLRRKPPGSRRCIRGYTGWDCRPTEPEHGQQHRQRRQYCNVSAGCPGTADYRRQLPHLLRAFCLFLL